MDSQNAGPPPRPGVVDRFGLLPSPISSTRAISFSETGPPDAFLLFSSERGVLEDALGAGVMHESTAGDEALLHRHLAPGAGAVRHVGQRRGGLIRLVRRSRRHGCDCVRGVLSLSITRGMGETARP